MPAGWTLNSTTIRCQPEICRFCHRDHSAARSVLSLYAEREFTYNNIRQSNRNTLLFRDRNVDGMKTGWTDAAGYCLVASAERDGMRLISVVMGTSSEEARAIETQKLLTYGFDIMKRTSSMMPDRFSPQCRCTLVPVILLIWPLRRRFTSRFPEVRLNL